LIIPARAVITSATYKKGVTKVLKVTEDLYRDSEFYRWLETRPANVYCDYNPHYVDMAGTRVTITFSIDDEVTE
jgi:hypothetical protein